MGTNLAELLAGIFVFLIAVFAAAAPWIYLGWSYAKIG